MSISLTNNLLKGAGLPVQDVTEQLIGDTF